MDASYFILWRKYRESRVAFTYDRMFGALSSKIVNLPFTTLITDTDLTFRYAGEPVLRFYDSGLIQAVSFANAIPHADFPRLDFCRQITDTPQVLASLTSTGKLYCPNMLESDTLPDSDDQMVFWEKISFTPNGLTAREFLANANFV